MTIMVLLPLQAHAQSRMRDYSLSPEESLRQPNISHAQTGNFDSYFQPHNEQQQPTGLGQNGMAGIQPSNRFMSGYCDPNFHPMVTGTGNLGALQACIAQKKQQACQQFQQLPADAQSVLDASIGCAYTAANSDDGSASDCSAFDSRRLQLLKKYGDDAATSHALVYLQDDVVGAGNECMRGGR